MRKFLSERNIAGCLFIIAFVVFFFAKQDTNKAEREFQQTSSSVSSLLPSLPASALILYSAHGVATGRGAQ